MDTAQGNRTAEPSCDVADIFGRDAQNPSVCVVDGHGVAITMNAGQLLVKDGIGRSRRTRRYARATHGLRRVVVLGSSGTMTIEAIKWLEGVGIGFVVIDSATGEVVSASTRVANDDARLRRAQALCGGTETGLLIAKRLIDLKLQGQAMNALECFSAMDKAETIHDLRMKVTDAGSLEEVRQLEASAANLYWSSWQDLEIRFVKKDEQRVPSNWKVFEGRRSAINPGSSRNSSDPINSLLNYTYRLLEAEGQLATMAVGLDPGLGILHADLKGRASFVLDLIEAIRPTAERHVVNLVTTHALQWRDFHEDERGVVRVLAPLTHRLAEAMGGFATALAPVAEEIASLLGEASPYDVSTPSVLTKSKHKEAARRRTSTPSREGPTVGPSSRGMSPRSKTRQKPRNEAVSHLPLPTCQVCGVVLKREADRTRRRGSYCPECLTTRRLEIGASIQKVSSKGRVKDPETSVRRSQANADAKLEQQRWEAEHQGETFDREWFSSVVVPGLQGVSLTTIAKATGMSTSAASKVRAGKRVPHPRHWEGLVALMEDGVGARRSGWVIDRTGLN